MEEREKTERENKTVPAASYTLVKVRVPELVWVLICCSGSFRFVYHCLLRTN